MIWTPEGRQLPPPHARAPAHERHQQRDLDEQHGDHHPEDDPEHDVGGRVVGLVAAPLGNAAHEVGDERQLLLRG